MGESTASDPQPKSNADFRVERDGTTGTLTVTGFLTSSGTQCLSELLGWQFHDGISVVIVDLGVSTGIDSASILVLRGARARLQRRGGDLIVRSARPDVNDELRLVGLVGATEKTMEAGAGQDRIFRK